MANYDVSTNYYSANTQIHQPRSKKAGAALLGGIAGMTCYYLPISKDTFVNVAFSAKQKSVDDDINGLKQAADEISKNKVTNESRILLNRLGIGENLQEISDKCKALKEQNTDTDTVKSIKKEFADNFKSYKKDASKMDSIAAKAMSTIKWNGFKWGMGIGAVLGLALSLVFGKNSNT